MANSYLDQGYEQGGVPGLIQNVWNAPGVYAGNIFRETIGQNPYLNPAAPGPADYGKLDRPQRGIFEELFLYNTGRQMPEQTLMQPVQAPEPVQQEPIPTAASAASTSFLIPGYKSSVRIPEPPDLEKTRKAIAELEAPGQKKPDALATLMQAMANTRWDDRSATGTNLFNIGMRMLGGIGIAREEEAQAAQAAEQAAYQNDLKQLELDVALGQQDFTNRMSQVGLISKEDERRYRETAPQIVGNSVLYKTRLPSGDIRAEVKQVGENKFERMLSILDKMTQNSTVDITNAVQTGQVPLQFTQVLIPKILEYQTAATEELGANIALMDDRTKQQTINMYVNSQLMNDPEVGGIVQQLQNPLRQNAIYQEALKRGL